VSVWVMYAPVYISPGLFAIQSRISRYSANHIWNLFPFSDYSYTTVQVQFCCLDMCISLTVT